MPFHHSRTAAPRAALGVLFAALAFIAAAVLHPALWLFAGLAAVLGAGAVTAPLEHARRDHTASTAFVVA